MRAKGRHASLRYHLMRERCVYAGCRALVPKTDIADCKVKRTVVILSEGKTNVRAVHQPLSCIEVRRFGHSLTATQSRCNRDAILSNAIIASIPELCPGRA